MGIESRSSLLHRVRRYGDQHPDLGGSCTWGRSKLWLQSGPSKGRGRKPLGESTQTHSHLLVPISASQNTHVLSLRGISGTHAVPVGAGGFTLPEDAARRRPTVSTVNGCMYRGRGDGPRVPPGQQRGSRGRILPPSLNPWEVTTKRRMKTRKRGRKLPLPTLCLPMTSPHLVNSLASKRGSPSARADRNGLGW
jgi:hypothetical protein